MVSTHRALDEEQEQSFLARSELDQLVEMPDALVDHAIKQTPKLAGILVIANRDGWWFAGKACEQDNLEWCSRCKPTGYPSTVYVTRGWRRPGPR